MNRVPYSFDQNANHGNRQARPAAIRLSCILVLALALAGGFGARAQDSIPAPQTNDVTQIDGMSAADNNGQPEDMVAGDENTETNAVGETNDQSAAPTEDARARRLRRQRQNRSRSFNQANGLAQGSSTTNGAPSSLDYSAFQIVADRNIFDPNRFPRSGPRQQIKTVESFGLVGTLSYDKGDFAFFDGTSSDYRKVLKASETIAGYKVLAVLPDSVKLSRSTNELTLAVGTQLRRQDDGTWVQAASPAAYDATPAASSGAAQPGTAATASTGAESDIIKRMMQRREKE